MARMVADGDLDEETYKDTIESLQGDVDDKIDAYANVIADYKGKEKTVAEEIARLQSRKAGFANAQLRMKTALLEFLGTTGKRKIATTFHTVWKQNGPKTADIVDEMLIPSQYTIKRAPQIDRRLIAETLKAGGDVPGAILKDGKEGVRIR